jgi:hypothetical protein
LKNFFFLWITMLLSYLAAAQIKYPTPYSMLGPRNRVYDRIERREGPVVFSHGLIYNRTDIDTMFAIRSEPEIKRLFGNKHGVENDAGKCMRIIIRLKRRSVLLSLDQILDAYHIPAQDRRLPIVVDDRYQDFPDDLYGIKSAIAYVHIQKHCIHTSL